MNIQSQTCNLKPATLQVLVIGYGNTLRSDDGVGQAVVERVKAWNLPNVQVLTVHQLTPELAEPLSNADLAIFVDAYPADFEQEVQVCPLEPASSGWTMGHTSAPKGLLAIAQALYNYYPQAWLVAIPAQNFELGYSLSLLAEQGMEEALNIIDELIREALALPRNRSSIQ
ncbi:MAG TPA: hydrogenase maturation protease [Stenomitos sp.]